MNNNDFALRHDGSAVRITSLSQRDAGACALRAVSEIRAEHHADEMDNLRTGGLQIYRYINGVPASRDQITAGMITGGGAMQAIGAAISRAREVGEPATLKSDSRYMI